MKAPGRAQPSYVIEAFDPKAHDRLSFTCDDANKSFELYFRTKANQDQRRGTAVIFVAVTDGRTVVGYYTLSATRIDADKLPRELAKRLPTGEVIPGTLLGRLAVDVRYREQHVGEILLMDALSRAVANSKQVASFAVVLDAKTAASRAFLMRYDFQPFTDDPHKLFLPMKTIEPLFAE